MPKPLLIARHAQPDRRGPNAPLSQLGRLQAEALASLLESIELFPDIIVVASTRAAHETAEIVASKRGRIELVEDRRLDPVPFEIFLDLHRSQGCSDNDQSGVTKHDSDREDVFIRQALASWTERYEALGIIGPRQYLSRAIETISHYSDLSNEQTLIITAAGVIESVIRALARTPEEIKFGSIGVEIAHAGLTKLRRDRLEAFNQTLHLEARNLITHR